MTPEERQAHLFSALLQAIGAINALHTPLAMLSSAVRPEDRDRFNQGMEDFATRIKTAVAELEKYTNG